jgi:hypothetical protein
VGERGRDGSRRAGAGARARVGRRIRAGGGRKRGGALASACAGERGGAGVTWRISIGPRGLSVELAVI